MQHHYFRPHLDSFLIPLFSHPRVQIGFYTSIMLKNASIILEKIFNQATLSEYRDRIFEVFDQTYNVPLRDKTLPPWETKRNLNKVLKHQKCRDYGFGLHNTIMIDNEFYKIKDFQKNSILIKEYEESQVKKPTEDQSKILMEVKDYLFNLLEESSDVRSYIEKNKPKFFEGDYSFPNI